jgi:hypothetical protein
VARAHNQAVGSFEGRILPTARRMTELGVADGASIELPAPVETQIRRAANGNGSKGRTRGRSRLASVNRHLGPSTSDGP